jgi:hypothetical protein
MVLRKGKKTPKKKNTEEEKNIKEAHLDVCSAWAQLHNLLAPKVVCLLRKRQVQHVGDVVGCRGGWGGVGVCGGMRW